MKFPPWWGYGYFLELHIDRYTSFSHEVTIFDDFSTKTYATLGINMGTGEI